jgi:hypothetical protein
MIFEVNGKEVCSKYFANVVGMVDSNGYKNKQWVDETKIYLNLKPSKEEKDQKKRSANGSRREKREHAYAYILKVVDSQIMDKSAYANYENHLYLPYHTLTSFFDEYVYLCNQAKAPMYAQVSTFSLAMGQVKRDKKRKGISIRLSGAKGIFVLLLSLHDLYYSCHSTHFL